MQRPPCQDDDGDLVFLIRVKGLPASHLSPRDVAWELVAQHWTPSLWARYGARARIEIEERVPCCDGADDSIKR